MGTVMVTVGITTMVGLITATTAIMGITNCESINIAKAETKVSAFFFNAH